VRPRTVSVKLFATFNEIFDLHYPDPLLAVPGAKLRRQLWAFKPALIAIGVFGLAGARMAGRFKSTFSLIGRYSPLSGATFKHIARRRMSDRNARLVWPYGLRTFRDGADCNECRATGSTSQECPQAGYRSGGRKTISSDKCGDTGPA
jgi:hypothetical protein